MRAVSRMRPYLPGRLRMLRTVLLCGVLSCLGACSVVGTLYERLDVLLGFEAGSWLDLDEAQMRQFRSAVRLRVEQHRQEELPRYIEFLERAATRVEAPPDDATLLNDAEELRLLLRETIRRSLPLLADTLATLRPAQVEHLAVKFAQSNEEYAEEYLEQSPERFRKKRLARSREAIERWTGRLDDAQRARVAALVDEVPDGSAAWSAYSHAWQQALLAQLRAGASSAQLLALMERWWTTDAAMDPSYVAQLEGNRRLIAGSLAGLLPTLGERQRARVSREFRSLAADLRDLLRPDQPAGAR